MRTYMMRSKVLIRIAGLCALIFNVPFILSPLLYYLHWSYLWSSPLSYPLAIPLQGAFWHRDLLSFTNCCLLHLCSMTLLLIDMAPNVEPWLQARLLTAFWIINKANFNIKLYKRTQL
ncbi:hypothetical protein FGO68_gene15059 [Halteria grandinella]|uniref:Uncharacterized protein n=1 Tax=Halteria grandinella TaxID=5974 RepID=A0A8J8SW80_HALGN|nr:hypothetical protein FGO68_gene15059 [Halteria grandinella]